MVLSRGDQIPKTARGIDVSSNNQGSVKERAGKGDDEAARGELCCTIVDAAVDGVEDELV